MTKPAAPAQRTSVIKMYAAREEIYPLEVKGRYASMRWTFVWLTQILFYGLPWLQWNDRQAVLFDLLARKFYIFGLVLWPQDFIYLTGLLIISAYSLFLATAIAGRVWCGFTCPQTVYTEIFMWVERKIEGSRSARMRLDKEGPSLAKLGKKTAKHAIWIGIGLWTGFTFVGYFTPILTLTHEVLLASLGPWELFWVLFYGFATYGNAGWMREQVCKYMCPYARFQSAMFDKDTLIITYDDQRGEPRGARKVAANSAANPAANPAAANLAANPLGDCIDCTLCVQVCPTGIDIRKGLQYECIGCAACIDACNIVMDKVGSPRDLIRYSTDRAIKNQFTAKQIMQRAFRPRVLIYSAILGLIICGFGFALITRTPLKLDVIRDRGAMGREVEDGIIENVYRLQVMNTDERPHRFRITVSGIDSIALAGVQEISLAGTESRAAPVRVRLAHGQGHPGSNKIMFHVQALEDEQLQVKEKAVFSVPR
jgi:cytochrome c oxidase accessory protein FixG